MADLEFGEVRLIPMNEIWEHEERNFTPWLAKNISKLGDALGLALVHSYNLNKKACNHS